MYQFNILEKEQRPGEFVHVHLQKTRAHSVQSTTVLGKVSQTKPHSVALGVNRHEELSYRTSLDFIVAHHL